LIPVTDRRLFSSPQFADRFGAHPALYPVGTGGLFPRRVKLTTHLHLVPRLRIRGGALLPLPIRLHGLVIN
jgi:hypothetical protein